MVAGLLYVCAAIVAAEDLIDGPIEAVAEGHQFTEGPCWLPSNELVFTDIPADAIFKTGKVVYLQPSGKANGLTLDPRGRLIRCEHWNRRVTRSEADGTDTVLADNYEGKKFNSPNDAIVRADGTVYFTDPRWGLEGREPEIGFSGVYRIAPDGTVSLVAQDFTSPNGIGLSPDEKTLYVADDTRGEIRTFAVAEDGSTTGGEVFAKVPTPDGMCIDTAGRVWTSSARGVDVFEADGTHLGSIAFPQQPANCAFGGEDGKTLFATARTAVYRVRVKVPGLVPGRRK